MLTAAAVLAHQGRAPWHLDPVPVAGLALLAWAYHRGRARSGRVRPGDAGRSRCFWVAMITLAVALVSPLAGLADELASAHMVQHVLLVLVASPLLALGAPLRTMAPLRWPRPPPRWRRRLRVLRRPAVVWLLHAGVLWFWHASVPYGAALQDDRVHGLEHASFVITGVLFWSVVVRARGAPRVSYGLSALLVFTMAMQSVFLSVLLTFARTPWYAGYATTAGRWGLDPLADQQLAGVIMWVPAAGVYVVAGLLLVTAWIRETEEAATGRPSP